MGHRIMSHHITTPTKPMQWLKAMVLLVMLVLAQTNAFAQATVTFFHNDIAGTPLAATDSAGNLVWKETYRPYGDRLTQSPASSGNGVWFAGKPQDARTGLVYMGARYYDPAIGRFMGTDPVGFVEGNVHSVNRYAYANNNPYRYVDPDGRYADLAIEAVSLTVGFHSLIGNWRDSNWSGAAVDAGGIVVDVVGAAIPGIPGAAGLGIKASREAAELAAKGAGLGAKEARALAQPIYKTTKEAKVAAEALGFTKINETVHGGQAVFKRGKDFITRDLDGHNGGAWKMADSVKNLGSRETRAGTFDVKLNRIGD